ncbi:MAG: hypothetical protein GXO78_00230 [Calditrichaeota bacterium]|nr:hypothetical protein [Calditrichota bacterium]
MPGHVRKHVVDYTMGRLPSHKKRRVIEHLRDCPECRQYFEAVARLFSPPEDTERYPLEPDPFLLTRIRERKIAAEKTPLTEPSSAAGLRWINWGILVGLALLVGVSITRFTDRTDWESYFIVTQMQEALNYGDDMLTQQVVEPFVDSKIEMQP